MKTRCVKLMFAVLVGVMMGQDALAFYNSSTGRWLNRDPLAGEVSADSPGRSLKQVAGLWTDLEQEHEDVLLALKNPAVVQTLTTSADNLVLRQLIRIAGERLYVFSENDGPNKLDVLGLWPLSDPKPTVPISRTVPMCSIEIYTGHGFLLRAFDDEGKLKNPEALAKLQFPYILNGGACSGGAIVACNAKKFGTVGNQIPGYELVDKDITVDQGYGELNKVVGLARAHAASLCNSCCCKAITIQINCTPPHRRPGVFRGGSPHCGQTYTVACPSKNGDSR